MSDEFYEAFEEWAVITVDGNVDDITALKYIQNKYSREIATQIWEKYCRNE